MALTNRIEPNVSILEKSKQTEGKGNRQNLLRRFISGNQAKMADELSGFLESSLNVTLDPFGTTKQHPRFSQFKQKNHKASQEERRRLTLEIQKQ